MPITDPTDIADLSLWLRADSIVGLSDGDFVTAWTDESANARSFEQADTSKAPIWQDNDINGLPAVEFGVVASDDYLETASAFDALGGLFNAGGDAVTIFLVQYQAGSQANHGNLAWHTFGAHITYSDSIYFDAANNTTGRINVAQPGGWDDAFHIVELYRSGSSGEINVDGSNLLSSSFSASLASVTTTMVLGRYASTYFKGKFAEIVFYARALTSGQRTDVYDYLYGKYFAAGGYTLTAATGSFTETGQAANLLFGRKVSAAAGSFAHTGQDASLRLDRKLAANAGAFTETGQDAGLLYGRRLGADAGAFIFTGQDATLRKGYAVSAGTGAFLLTGQDASLKAARLLSAGVGVFVLTGRAVDLQYSGNLQVPGINLTVSDSAVLNLTTTDSSVLRLTVDDTLATG